MLFPTVRHHATPLTHTEPPRVTTSRLNPTYRGIFRLQLLFLGEEAEAVPQRHFAPSKPFLGGKGSEGSARSAFPFPARPQPRLHVSSRDPKGSFPPSAGSEVGSPNPCPIHPWNALESHLRDGQGQVTKHLEGRGAIPTGLALETTFQLAHKQV